MMHEAQTPVDPGSLFDQQVETCLNVVHGSGHADRPFWRTLLHGTGHILNVRGIVLRAAPARPSPLPPASRSRAADYDQAVLLAADLRAVMRELASTLRKMEQEDPEAARKLQEKVLHLYGLFRHLYEMYRTSYCSRARDEGPTV